MEVLTIPYDEGFKLTRKDSEGKVKEIKLYKAQGGFNSLGTVFTIYEKNNPDKVMISFLVIN